VSSRLMGLKKEGSLGSLPSLCADATRAAFHACGKHCLRRTALNSFVGKVIASFGRCLRTLFRVIFGHGAFQP
jgi:hypothetical protein